MPDPIAPNDTSALTVTTESTPVTPPVQVAAPAKTFTQEEVDQIVKSRLERASRKPEPAVAKTAEPRGEQPVAAPSIDDIDRRIERHGQLARATANLDEEQARLIGDLMRSANPPDVPTWCAQTIAALKLGKSPAPLAATATQAVPATTPKPLNDRPASDRGSPPPAAVPREESDIITMSESDRRALIKEKGAKWFVAKYKEQAKGRQIRLT